MSYQPQNDNIYQVGTRITAAADPGLQLEVRRYYQRIYYCTVVGDPDGKNLVYFENELVPPAKNLK